MEIIKFLQQFSNPILDKFFIFTTMLGEDLFFILAITFIFWCVDKKFAYKLGFAYMLNGAINSSLKIMFAAERPIGTPGILSIRTETATGYSFPSGHTESSASFWTSIMLETQKRWMYIVGIVLIILVAMSRLYLGVHWPQDVLVGAVLGVCIVFVSNNIYDYLNKSKNKHRALFLLIPVLLGLFVFDSEDYYKVAGVVSSFVLGYVLDELYIKYDSRALPYQQIIKYVIGISVLLCIKSGVKVILPDMHIFHFVRYFLMGAWMVVLAPMVFKYVLIFGTASVKRA